MEWATVYLRQKQIDQPRLSIEWLLAHILQVPRLNLYLMFDRPLTSEELERLRPLIKRRAKHEPIQYITGTTSFLDYEFQVDPSVLIPRPETEELVERVLNDLANPSSLQPLRILDVGTGSGCIAISLAAKRPEWNISATDISKAALDVAASNAERIGVNVRFVEHDLMSDKEWDALVGENAPLFDAIVSNPPYIFPDEAPSMDPQVKDHEPHLALFHQDPVHLISHLIRKAREHLQPNGSLYIELNPRFGESALNIALEHFNSAHLKADLSGRHRFLISTTPLQKGPN